jgi:hypothetical protein
VAAEARLGALGILELDHAHALDGVLAHAKQAGRDLGDDVVVVGLQTIVKTALAGAGEGVPRSRSTRLGHDGVDTDRAEGHAAAVDRQINVHLRSAIVATIEIEACVDLGGIHLGWRRWKTEVETIETAPGLAGAVFEARLRRVPGFGHVPGGKDQVRCPARIAHGVDRRIARQRQRLLGALGDTIMVGLGTRGANAQVIARPQREGVAVRLHMHALRTQLGAVAAAHAVGRAVDLVLTESVAVAIRHGSHLALDGDLRFAARGNDRIRSRTRWLNTTCRQGHRKPPVRYLP